MKNGETILVVLIFVVLFVGYLYWFRKSEEKSRETFNKMLDDFQTPEGQERLKKMAEGFETLRQVNRNAKAGRPLLDNSSTEDEPKSVDKRIEDILKKNRDR